MKSHVHTPAQIHSWAQVFVDQHADLVSAELQSLLEVEAVGKWDPPWVINGMGVVVK